MTTSTISAPRTLHDLIPRANNKTIAIATDIALMVGFALFTAAMAQVSFHLGFTPVPITGQTFAVLLAGASLGTVRGAGSQIIYLLMGLVFPFYSDGAHGWTVVKGATGGYIVGFIVAAALVGYLAERKNDRNIVTAIPAFLAGTAIIYIFGAVWLAHVMNIPFAADAAGSPSAITYGVAPFIIGDVLKAAVAGAILPASWAFVKKIKQQEM